MIGDTWYPTELTRTLKYFLADSSKHKATVHQFNLIGAFLKANVKHNCFVELESTYGEYLPEYANYFGRPLRPKKSMYGMNNNVKIFSDEIVNQLIYEEGFNHSQCQMYIH